MARQYETKDIDFKFEIADEADPGTFTGYASIFEAVDSYGDSVQRGAFRKTLREKGGKSLLWSHQLDQPIGVWSAVEDDKGLVVTGKLNMKVQRAVEVRELMIQGAVTGLSIGYNVVKEQIDRETGVRQLKEIKLWEISPCVFQACPGALIDGVKSGDAGDGAEPGEPTPRVKPETLHLIDETIALINRF